MLAAGGKREVGCGGLDDRWPHYRLVSAVLRPGVAGVGCRVFAQLRHLGLRRARPALVRDRSGPRRRQPEHPAGGHRAQRSEEHTSELQSLMRISYAVFCLKKKKKKKSINKIRRT